jgi:hypothetical protein
MKSLHRRTVAGEFQQAEQPKQPKRPDRAQIDSSR